MMISTKQMVDNTDTLGMQSSATVALTKMGIFKITP